MVKISIQSYFQFQEMKLDTDLF